MLRSQSVKSVRTFAAASKGVRALSTATSTSKSTTLSNGLTIATEANPYAKTATVGFWVKAGVRAENRYNNGISNVLEHVFYKSSPTKSPNAFEAEAEALGAQFSSKTTKEVSSFYTQASKQNIIAATSLLADVYKNPEFKDQEIYSERVKAVAATEAADANPEYLIQQHLHAVAFPGSSLSLPVLGDKEVIPSIEKMDLDKFYKKNFVPENTVLVGSGAIEHEALVELAEKKLASIPSGGASAPLETPAFLGAEVRDRDDTIPIAYFTFAVDGASLNSPDYYTALIAKTIIGEYDVSSPSSRLLSSPLSQIVSDNHLAKSYKSFSASYTDSGLWGITVATDNLLSIDDLSHFTLKQWNRLSTSVDPTQVERAKAQLKTAILASFNSNLAVADDIGNKIVTSGRRPSVLELFKLIDEESPATVTKWAQNKLWDRDLSIAAYGSIEGLFDYNRLRNEMALLRW